MNLNPLSAYKQLAHWELQRVWISRFGQVQWTSQKRPTRVLLLTNNDSISQSQVFPFFLFRQALGDKYRIALHEMDVPQFERQTTSPGRFDIVVLQFWFDFRPDRIRTICEKIHHLVKPTRVAFLDGYAHTDLRLAKVLDPYIDLYVKKHLFRDTTSYYRKFRGDTNLVDYYGTRYGFSHKEVDWEVPEGFTRKLVLGPGFVTSPMLLPYFCRQAPTQKSIDIHARMASGGTDWYKAMREESIRTIQRVRAKNIMVTPNVGQREYMRELDQSALCFSPFGYGEIAWRDAEAVACGATLLKPDMGHLQTVPDLFVPFQTYVPLKWDFSDTVSLAQKYLENKEERQEIASRARSVARDYLQSEAFVGQMSRVFG